MISGVVYLYLAICVSLLIFNAAYIAGIQHRGRRRARRAQRWRRRFENVGTHKGLKKRTVYRLRHIE